MALCPLDLADPSAFLGNADGFTGLLHRRGTTAELATV